MLVFIYSNLKYLLKDGVELFDYILGDTYPNTFGKEIVCEENDEEDINNVVLPVTSMNSNFGVIMGTIIRRRSPRISLQKNEFYNTTLDQTRPHSVSRSDRLYTEVSLVRRKNKAKRRLLISENCMYR